MKKQSTLFVKLYLLIAFIGVFAQTNAQIIEAKSITCAGLSNGQLNIHPTFGTAPYTYLWSNGETSNIAKGLSVGPYSVDVTDATLITVNYTYNLTEPFPITNSFVITPNSSWPINNGDFVITTLGGSGSFSYAVTDSTSEQTTIQNTNTFSALPSGTYYVQTSDVNACAIFDTVRISENADLLSAHTIDTTACYRSTASTVVTPDVLTTIYPVDIYFDDVLFKTLIGYVVDPINYSDGVSTFPVLGITAVTPPYVESVGVVPSGPNAGQDSITLFSSAVSKVFPPGLHTLKVVTADNKGYRYSWVVDSVDTPISINYTQTNNICRGNNDGQITALAQGSYNGFIYNIQGPVGFTPVATSSASLLGAGKYRFTATDAGGCSKSQDIYIEEPDDFIQINPESVKNTKCSFVSDGAITISMIDGAVPPVSFLWSNGATTQSIGSLLPGLYSVTATDANGCVAIDSIYVVSEKANCIYNIVTPNGDGYNDFLDLTDLCEGVQMEATIFDDAGRLVATLTENNPKWDAYDPVNPPTGTSSTFTVFIRLSNNGVTTSQIGESFSVIYSNK